MNIAVRHLALALALAACSLSAGAETWPAKPVKFVVPFGPGGANDLVARAVADAASKQLGQPIIVENKPGAGSALGADYVAKAAPDGYTFLAPAAGVITNAMIKAHLPYKEQDLVPVAMLAVSPSIIVVPADSPIKDLKGLVALGKAGKSLNFATAGTGSTPHFVAEMLKLATGAKLEIIPYKSGSEGMVAVVGKQVDATSEASVVVLPQVKGGKLRAIASTWNTRIAAMPDVPTTAELGYPGVFIGHWSGVFAPRGTPDAILDKMNKAIDVAIKSPELRARLIPQGIQPMGGTRADFTKFLAGEKARLGPIARAANMKED
ncbi:tripartite tricarboxylate transporter substrate binding protein [Cupriavidus sp. UYPR2.512]|uniref:tripartite tricarboxylate transporter substrate binding protein n=1 Tax=Cupriavidus sp. UYPR2.512 TaxID=1080187 RepID=UPI0003731BB1|nr:tripartite tricarboxylate transporter substrate binding protein [Cupriavidus sp. UYPR2.512]UIF89627.1 tripartite tricarboxylate transporter substrate binding protein [Cupriavidus necator]